MKPGRPQGRLRTTRSSSSVFHRNDPPSPALASTNTSSTQHLHPTTSTQHSHSSALPTVTDHPSTPATDASFNPYPDFCQLDTFFQHLLGGELDGQADPLWDEDPPEVAPAAPALSVGYGAGRGARDALLEQAGGSGETGVNPAGEGTEGVAGTVPQQYAAPAPQLADPPPADTSAWWGSFPFNLPSMDAGPQQYPSPAPQLAGPLPIGIYTWWDSVPPDTSTWRASVPPNLPSMGAVPQQYHAPAPQLAVPLPVGTHTWWDGVPPNLPSTSYYPLSPGAGIGAADAGGGEDVLDGVGSRVETPTQYSAKLFAGTHGMAEPSGVGEVFPPAPAVVVAPPLEYGLPASHEGDLPEPAPADSADLAAPAPQPASTSPTPAPRTSTPSTPGTRFPHIPREIITYITANAVSSAPADDINWHLRWLLTHKEHWIEAARPVYREVKLSAENVQGFLGGEAGVALFDGPGLTPKEREDAFERKTTAEGLNALQRKMVLLSLAEKLEFTDLESVRAVGRAAGKMADEWPGDNDFPGCLLENVRWVIVHEQVFDDLWQLQDHQQIFSDLGRALPPSASACLHYPGGLLWYNEHKIGDAVAAMAEGVKPRRAAEPGGEVLEGLEQAVLHDVHANAVPSWILTGRLTLHLRGHFGKCARKAMPKCVGAVMYRIFTE
ncbi:hypothetical protein IAT38_006624 [Cryptococcus sp. DSM 104549]